MTCRLVVGSSPRLWGIRGLLYQGLIINRFIPTPVGNTNPCPRGPLLPTVHPHACGEYMNERARLMDDTGSSPRLWGIPRLSVLASS